VRDLNRKVTTTIHCFSLSGVRLLLFPLLPVGIGIPIARNIEQGCICAVMSPIVVVQRWSMAKRNADTGRETERIRGAQKRNETWNGSDPSRLVAEHFSHSSSSSQFTIKNKTKKASMMRRCLDMKPLLLSTTFTIRCVEQRR
jgi:hypothetical protein